MTHPRNQIYKKMEARSPPPSISIADHRKKSKRKWIQKIETKDKSEGGLTHTFLTLVPSIIADNYVKLIYPQAID